MKTHLSHVEDVLRVLESQHRFAKRSKCSLGQNEVEYLGHLMGEYGVKADPQKIQSMQNWPAPTSTKTLRGFLGLTEYFRRFVKNYDKIAQPLTTLLKKEAFHWDAETARAFEELKSAMSSTPVLALLDWGSAHTSRRQTYYFFQPHLGPTYFGPLGV